MAGKNENNTPMQNDNINGTGLSNLINQLDSTQKNNLLDKAANELLSIQAEAMRNQLKSQQAAIDDNAHADNFNRLSNQPGFTSQEIKSESNTGSGTRTITSRSGVAASRGACFIATSAFEDRNHPTVVSLRAWRDEFLARYSLGQSFIKWYYRSGRKMAKWQDNHSYLKPFTRTLLTLFTKIIAIMYLRKKKCK